jgi:hypothetical protein
MWPSFALALVPAPQELVHAAPAALVERDEPAASHARMLAVLDDIARRAAVSDGFVGEAEVGELEAVLAELTPGRQLPKRWETLCKLGKAQLRLGRNDEAVASYEKALALEPELEGKVEPRILLRGRVDAALAWMRVGEAANCVARHTSESCLAPIGEKGRHVDQAGSRRAIELLSGVLARDANDLRARWLLNLACMTVGEYPDGVPAEQRVPPKVFTSDEPFPRFVDVAPELGLNTFTLAGGVILDDFDGDDVLDVVTSDMHPRGKLQVWKGQRDGTFVERTGAANVAGIDGGLNILQTDYDNDGALDVLVLRGAWTFDKGQIPNSLLRNDGHARFTDVSFAAGIALPAYPTQAAAWADHDLDGDLDLYVGNEFSPLIAAPSQLFQNQGDGTFVDVAKEAGVLNNRYAKGVSFGDYDGDRYPDLYVSNLDDLNRLYHNERNGTFRNVAGDVGVIGPQNTFATWFWDFDNDGALDIYVATFLPRVEPYVQALLGERGSSELAALYKGDGKGGFVDVARTVGFDDVNVTMGANFGDLDLDGYLDFYLGTGFPDYEALMPNKMYWNRGGKRFADVTTAGGFGHLQKGHAIAFADLDRDGDQDVFAEMGGALAGDAFGNALFRNPGFGNHWLCVKLVGVRSSRAAIGARIRCDFEENGSKRSVYRHVNSGGSFGASPLRQTLGLGKATRVALLEVYWPTSDTTQVFRDVAVDQTLEIREGLDELRRVE